MSSRETRRIDGVVDNDYCAEKKFFRFSFIGAVS